MISMGSPGLIEMHASVIHSTRSLASCDGLLSGAVGAGLSDVEDGSGELVTAPEGAASDGGADAEQAAGSTARTTAVRAVVHRESSFMAPPVMSTRKSRTAAVNTQVAGSGPGGTSRTFDPLPQPAR
jgi:hypothetical protein